MENKIRRIVDSCEVFYLAQDYLGDETIEKEREELITNLISLFNKEINELTEKSNNKAASDTAKKS
jgi:hypothetical protein